MSTRRNLLTDIAGIKVGHAGDAAGLRSGVTVVLFDPRATAAVQISGGSPAARETALLELESTVEQIHAVVLSGGSTYGLDATAGVQAFLRERFATLPKLPLPRVPLVVQASLNDLVNQGGKDWGRFSPYAEFGYQAAAAALDGVFALGSFGAGIGAETAVLKGGIGSASAVTPQGHVVAALVAVNAVGIVTVGDGPHFWSAPYEHDAEFGGLGLPAAFDEAALRLQIKPATWAGTTIGIVATDATLSKAQARRLAVLAQGGVARAVWPAHLAQDGDTIFGISTRQRALSGAHDELPELGLAALQVTARAIARGVFEATSFGLAGEKPTWRDHFKS